VLAAAALAAAGCGDDGTVKDQGQNNPSSGSQAGGAPSSTGGQGTEVHMQDIKFQPSTIRVDAGQKITWTNDESVPHDVVATSGADFKSQPFSKGGTFSFTPQKSGTIKYECTLHPGMDGTIQVSPVSQ
jgi:plastocyanin